MIAGFVSGLSGGPQQVGLAGVDLAWGQHGAQAAFVGGVDVEEKRHALAHAGHAVTLVGEVGGGAVGPQLPVTAAVARRQVAAQAQAARGVAHRARGRHVALVPHLGIEAEFHDRGRPRQQQFREGALCRSQLVFSHRGRANGGQQPVQGGHVAGCAASLGRAIVVQPAPREGGVGDVQVHVHETRHHQLAAGVDDLVHRCVRPVGP